MTKKDFLIESSTLKNYTYQAIANKDGKIDSVKISCPCMTLKTKLPIAYKKDQNVELEFLYNMKGKRGENNVDIELGHGEVKSKLKLELHIETLFKLSPRLLIWRGSKDEKKITIQKSKKWQGKIKSLEYDKKTFKVELTDTGILIKPLTQFKDRKELIIILSEDEGERDIKIYMMQK